MLQRDLSYSKARFYSHIYLTSWNQQSQSVRFCKNLKMLLCLKAIQTNESSGASKKTSDGSSAGTDNTAKVDSTATTVVDAKSPATNAPSKDDTYDEETKPAVEHETVKHEHETREQTVLERERHQDHYHTTVQPLKAREVEKEEHDAETAAVEERNIDNDTNAAAVKAEVDADRAQFKNTSEEGETTETQTKEKTEVHENVHHHYHETIQPVIEKGMVIDVAGVEL